MILSIIIPAYNVEKYIDDCLSSIVQQVNINSNVEIIIINDGSTDSTLDKANCYISKGNVRVISQNNSGQSHARNRGIQEATGDYIWFVDSDDMISLCSVGILTSLIKSSNKNIDIIAFNGDYFLDNDDINFNHEQLSYLRPKFSNDIVSQSDFFNESINKSSYFVQPCHYVFNSKLIDDVKFVNGIIYEDNLFTTDLFIKGKRNIKVIPDILYRRRIRSGSTVTSQFTQKNVISFRRVVDELLTNRCLYVRYANEKYIDTYIYSMVDSYYIALLRVGGPSLKTRMAHMLSMVTSRTSFPPIKTLVFSVIPLWLYKVTRNKNRI
ncbi:glycosyltransferase family 2 protein [Vibrio cyclitrophicus]